MLAEISPEEPPAVDLLPSTLLTPNRGHQTDDLGLRIIARSSSSLTTDARGSATDETPQLQGRRRPEPARATRERSHVEVVPGAAVAAKAPAQSLRSGASAAGVPSSEATGAAVEPDRSLHRIQPPGIGHGG